MTFRLGLLLPLLSMPLLAQPSFDELRMLARAQSPRMAAAIPAVFQAGDLAKGVAWKGYRGDFVFALETQSTPLLVVNEHHPRAMSRVAGTALWYALVSLETGRTHNFHYLIDGKDFGGRTDLPSFGADSYEKPGVPHGTLHGKFVHKSAVYPGMESDYWVYVPAQYDAAKPAAVMVWQDGEVLMNREEPSRAQVVFDNLTHEGMIPVIIQVLVSPGFVEKRRMRSIEYDTVDATYTKFLLEEILPEVGKKWNLRQDGYSRAIAGDSSGGICAFNAAWQRPGDFTRVLSRIGSFTSIQWKEPGGHEFPFMIRKQDKRNIRVWLQDGSGDLENTHGSWPLQNIQMANSLKMREYDFHFSWGNGTHSRNGGHAELPEEMVWLWRDYDAAKTEQLFTMDPAEKDKPYWRISGLNRN